MHVSALKTNLGLLNPFNQFLFSMRSHSFLFLSQLIVSLINILDDGCLTVSILGILAFTLELKAVVVFGRIWRRQAELWLPLSSCHLTEARVTAVYTELWSHSVGICIHAFSPFKSSRNAFAVLQREEKRNHTEFVVFSGPYFLVTMHICTVQRRARTGGHVKISQWRDAQNYAFCLYLSRNAAQSHSNKAIICDNVNKDITLSLGF